LRMPSPPIVPFNRDRWNLPSRANASRSCSRPQAAASASPQAPARSAMRADPWVSRYRLKTSVPGPPRLSPRGLAFRRSTVRGRHRSQFSLRQTRALCVSPLSISLELRRRLLSKLFLFKLLDRRLRRQYQRLHHRRSLHQNHLRQGHLRRARMAFRLWCSTMSRRPALM
jgi:hypothetical protein